MPRVYRHFYNTNPHTRHHLSSEQWLFPFHYLSINWQHHQMTKLPFYHNQWMFLAIRRSLKVHFSQGHRLDLFIRLKWSYLQLYRRISKTTVFESVSTYLCAWHDIILPYTSPKKKKTTNRLTGERRYRRSRPRRRNRRRAVLRRRLHDHDPPRNLQRFLRTPTVRYCSTQQNQNGQQLAKSLATLA